MSNVVKTSIDIDVPPEEVWDVVMDPERLGDWVTIHRKLHKVSDRPLKEGSTLEQTLCLRGANFKVRWEVAEEQERKLARWEGKGPARSRAATEYRLSPDANGGTHFDYRNEFKAPLGPLGAAASRALVGGVPEREANRSLERLKALLEKR
jgi:carbon monoxide dehydrogenase subunit G